MRVIHLNAALAAMTETDALPQAVPAQGFVWVSVTRAELETQLPALQSCITQLHGRPLLDLHISDLLNAQLPSNYDYTSEYDILVFRRLSTAQPGAAQPPVSSPRSALTPPAPIAAGSATPTAMTAAATPTAAPAPPAPTKHSGPPVLRRIDTSPIGFAVFDQLLLTVHPADCTVRDQYIARLHASMQGETRSALGNKLPSSPADLMLRLINNMVDGYLELRRVLTRQLDHWQAELLKPKTRFTNWKSVLDARLALHQLDEICEDQRSAMQDWIDALETWPDNESAMHLREHELLKVRSRDVLEHIERVVHHVRRMEQSAETAVQMHFSVQSNRTNDIMRTLTALTAVFLPLNLITGFFGMNFEFMPIIHSSYGFWATLGLMLVLVIGLVGYFWRKRYIAQSEE